MTVVSIDEVKDRIEELARLAIGGEEVLITEAGIPRLALKPIDQPVAQGRRVPGMWAG